MSDTPIPSPIENKKPPVPPMEGEEPVVTNNSGGAGTSDPDK